MRHICEEWHLLWHRMSGRALCTEFLTTRSSYVCILCVVASHISLLSYKSRVMFGLWWLVVKYFKFEGNTRVNSRILLMLSNFVITGIFNVYTCCQNRLPLRHQSMKLCLGLFYIYLYPEISIYLFFFYLSTRRKHGKLL